MTDLPPKRLIWIASYPKSGSTWTRHFLASLLTGGPVKFDEFNRTLICNARTLYERYGDGSSLDDFASALRQRVAVQRGLNADCTDYMFVKTHVMYGAYAPKGSNEPIVLFDAQSAAGAIVLVRNPFDVAASFANHLEFPINVAVELMTQPNAILQAGKGSAATPMSSWSHNLTSWVEQPHIPFRVFRYEDFFLEPQ